MWASSKDLLDRLFSPMAAFLHRSACRALQPTPKARCLQRLNYRDRLWRRVRLCNKCTGIRRRCPQFLVRTLGCCLAPHCVGMLPGRGPENIPGNFFSLSSGQLASCSSCGLRCERALLASSALSSVRINRFNSEHVSKSPGMSRLPHTYGCTKSALTGTESTTVPLHLRKSYTYICRSCLATHRRQRPCGFACLRIST